MVRLIEATSKQEYQTAIQLFKEYHAAIDIDLEFQNFSQEIKDIQTQYARPEGAVFLAFNNENTPVGCVGVRKLNETSCELKRMYLKSASRGLGIGKLMLEKSIALGKELGYQKMRLDTLQTMHAAIGLYQKLGFYEIDPYRFNPLEGAKYFEIKFVT